jgi:CHAD domain-containing protein
VEAAQSDFGLKLRIPPDTVDGVPVTNRSAMLGTGPEEPPVWRAPAAELREQMSVDAAVREMIRVCLIQILGNTSAIAAGLGGHEHAHQARVGIRKLRTVLAEFGTWCPAIEPTWRADLAAIFEVLGKARDRDVVIAGWLRVLEREGAPKVTLPPPTADDSSAVLRSIAFTQLMLSLRAYAQGAPDASRDDPKLVDAVRRSLTTLRRRSVRHADGFRRRSVDEQHDIRRRLKRLRYVADLTAPLFGRKAVARYVAALEPAQNALGALNDLSVANAWLTGFTAIDPNAWFAVGWLRARLDTTVKACVKPLRKAERATPYWSR